MQVPSLIRSAPIPVIASEQVSPRVPLAHFLSRPPGDLDTYVHRSGRTARGGSLTAWWREQERESESERAR